MIIKRLYSQVKPYSKFLPMLILIITLGSSVAFNGSNYFDSDILIAGFSLVLVVITAGYASSTERLVKVTANEKKGKVIAEIARSIFSPMRENLVLANGYLEDGGYFSGFGYSGLPLKRPLNMLDGLTPPMDYITKPVDVITYEQQFASQWELKRPAKELLRIDDEILQRRYFDITRRCVDYRRNLAKLHSILDSIHVKCQHLDEEFKVILMDLLIQSKFDVEPADARTDIFFDIVIPKKVLATNNYAFNTLGVDPVYVNYIYQYLDNLHNIVRDHPALSHDIIAMEEVVSDFISCNNQFIQDIDALFTESHLSH